LAFNNSTRHRTPLSLALSNDGGLTWQWLIDIETESTGSFAYPFLLQDQFNPKITHMCYTYNSKEHNLKTIAYAKLDFSH